nr:reverse transcriptase domain-containing protein [Tanacetum cinerariifolium]
MQTRSSSRLISNPSSNPTPSTNLNPKDRNRRRSKQRIEDFNLEELSPPIVTMADQCTMAQLLQAPIEGYEDAIVVPAITADNFELKHGLLTLVQNKQFFGHEKEDPHAHVRYFNKITSTLKFPNVPYTHHIEQIRSYSHNKPVVAKVSINTSTSDISPDVAELKDMVKALFLDKKSQNQSPASVKTAEESCVTCGVNYNQGNASYRPPMMSNQIRPPGFPPALAYQASAPQTQGVSKEDFLAYVKANDACLYFEFGTLPSNTIANPRSDLKAITTRSGVSYDG